MKKKKLKEKLNRREALTLAVMMALAKKDDGLAVYTASHRIEKYEIIFFSGYWSNKGIKLQNCPNEEDRLVRSLPLNQKTLLRTKERSFVMAGVAQHAADPKQKVLTAVKGLAIRDI